jgi:hypothetical protein
VRRRLVLPALALALLAACSDLDTTLGLAIESSRARQAEATAAPEAFGAVVAPARRAPATPDEVAVAEAVQRLYDAGVPFAEAAAHLEAPAEVEASRQTFAALAAGVSGLRVVVGDVVVAGEHASFVADVYAGGRAVRVGLRGEASRSATTGQWQLSTAAFCGALAAMPLLVCP